MAQHTNSRGDRFFALRTFRVDGSTVSTPVLLAPDPRSELRWYACTPERSGKVRRLRRDPSVEVARSTSDGVAVGPWRRGTARELSEPRIAIRALRRRHGGAFAVFQLVTFLGTTRRTGGRLSALAVDLDEPFAAPVRTENSAAGRARLDTPTGLIASSLPPAVLVAVNAVAGPVLAVLTAATLALVVGGMRLRRGHHVGQAFGGLAAVAVSGTIAWSTGWSRSGVVVSDSVWDLLATSVLAASVIVRRPLVGLVWAVIHRDTTHRRLERASRRRFDVATSVWATVFLVRLAINDRLIADPTDLWLVVAKIGSGLPLTLVAAAGTAWAWWRAAPCPAARAAPHDPS